MKLKALLQSLIVSHIRRATHSISKMKLIIIDIKELFVLGHVTHHHVNKIKRTCKINLHGSFRLHYNWCSDSSHVAPEPPPNGYYPSSSRWNTTISATDCEGSTPLRDPSELSGYLNWLDQENKEVDEANEIDKLADLFIANCHEKFMLEKQESYRMFQEMMARSI
ncbi:unnamed protein product [Rhodiola kirilowii]